MVISTSVYSWLFQANSLCCLLAKTSNQECVRDRKSLYPTSCIFLQQSGLFGIKFSNLPCSRMIKPYHQVPPQPFYHLFLMLGATREARGQNRKLVQKRCCRRGQSAVSCSSSEGATAAKEISKMNSDSSIFKPILSRKSIFSKDRRSYVDSRNNSSSSSKRSNYSRAIRSKE